jgi:phosphoglycerate dehydrogenase-like enzyme
MTGPRVAVVPDIPHSPATVAEVSAVITSAGGEVVEPAAADGLIWLDYMDPDGLAATLRSVPSLRWVQLVTAGVDAMRPVMDTDRIWTSGKGLYSEPIAEYVLATVLACFRSIPAYVTNRTWTPQPTRTLIGAKVTVVGGGGIGSALVRLLQAWHCEITVVRRHVQPMAGVASVVADTQLRSAVADADVVVLALALTADNAGIVDADILAAMPPRAWLVNVARGPHVVTADLVDALAGGRIAGAVLDVTDPEPLPSDHPLWKFDNCLITPHTSCPGEIAKPYLLARISDNIGRFARGETLDGLVDTTAGY